jgi:hypothetical protein
MFRLIPPLKPAIRWVCASVCIGAGAIALSFGEANIESIASQKMTEWVANTHPEDTLENRKMGAFLLNEFTNIGNQGIYWGGVAGMFILGGFFIFIDQSPVTTEEKKRLIKKLQEEVDHEEVFAQTYAALKEVKTHDDT